VLAACALLAHNNIKSAATAVMDNTNLFFGSSKRILSKKRP
jgi:hypothetical protein